jgi:cell division septation protein DedD
MRVKPTRQLNEGAKKRLTGTAVFIILFVVFVPMLIDENRNDDISDGIPDPLSSDIEFEAIDLQSSDDALATTPFATQPSAPTALRSPARDDETAAATTDLSGHSVTPMTADRVNQEQNSVETQSSRIHPLLFHRRCH